MRFNIVSIFPEMVKDCLAKGVVGKGIDKGMVEITYTNPRDHTVDKYRSIDDRPFGGSDGMVMMPEPVAKSLSSIKKTDPDTWIVYLSAQGKKFNQDLAKVLSCKKSITLLCGRYGGIDQRAINNYVDEEISIGDFVLSGGEIAALAVVDTVSRLIPGVLGNHESAANDSFMSGLLEGPLFTRPREFEGQKVPEVLLSGDHSKIKNFTKALALMHTFIKRKDLLGAGLRELEGLADNELSSLGIDESEIHDFKNYLDRL